MEYLYDVDSGEIMTHLTAWLSSEDKELVHSAVLCIGNIARTDKHSTSIVEKNIHKLLLNILKDESNDIKMQYAVISTIRLFFLFKLILVFCKKKKKSGKN